jgi:YfiH family protein
MNSVLVNRSINGLSFYQYPLLQDQPGLIHGVFSRLGGISEGIYGALNLSFSVWDETHRVRHNRELVQKTLGLKAIKSLKQVHGKSTVVMEGPPEHSSESEKQAGDILMTRIPGLGLMIKQADCQSVLLYDPRQRAVANLHCGWRGHVANVIQEAIEQMQAVYGTHPADLMAGIGPSLGPCCAQFIHYRQEFPEPYWKYQVRPYYFDLWQLSRDQLTAGGVLASRIQIAGVCTSCRNDLFFSYRKEKTTGRFATIVALKDDLQLQ